MMKKLFFLSVMLFAAISVCNASKIDGKWKTSMGDMELTFIFKAVGDTVLTGTVSSPMGDLPIKNGKIKGDSFTFDVEMEGNAIGHSCKLEGDVIKMKINMPDGMGGGGDAPGEMVLKKVEEK
jgi:hypothetical protein